MDKQTSFGLISTVTNPVALSYKSSCWSKDGLVLANYILEEADAKSAFKIAYTLIDSEGNQRELMQTAGTMPNLFVNNKEQNFVCLSSISDDKTKAVVVAVKDKATASDTPQSEINTFAGHFIGCSNENSIFFHVDIWKETTLDQMTVLHFDNANNVTQTIVDIPLPKGNKIAVYNNEIHLITETEEGWLHRQIDQTGKEIKRRVLDFEFPFVHEALSLSFSANSYLLCEENGEIGVVEIKTDDDCSYTELFDISDEFFGTWQPQRVSSDTAAVQFTTEFGNGWLTLKNDELVELCYNKNKKGYKNLLTKEVFELDNNDYALGGINALKNNTYGIVFYPRKNRKETYNSVVILQHTI